MTKEVKHNIEIGEITFLQDKKGIGNMMRCTVTWAVTGTPYGDLMVTIEGCLVARKMDGRLYFAPPKSIWGKGSKYLIQVSVDLANCVLDIVGKSKYNGYIGEVLPEGVRSRLPSEVGNLPELLTNDGEGEGGGSGTE